MTFANVLSLIGGLGMFLFGMRAMGEGLEKTAGDRLQKIIESLTSNLIKGVLVGTVVTALIQSSSATTVMVIGFVNAGVMTLGQAVGVIMGANVGTTITAQILRLAGIQSSAWYLMIFKPAFLAPVAIIIGVFLLMFTKRKRSKSVGEILAGFGVLFMGMEIMGDALKPLQDMPEMQQLFAVMGENPVLGVLTGAGVTALIQSSSASIGILQAVAATGIISFASALPIILGQNIGTCVTAMLSSIGATKNAKKAAVIHLAINIIGTLVFLVGMYGIQHFIGFPFWDNPISMGGVANFHTIFNVINIFLLLPFTGLLVKLANFLVRAGGRSGGKEPANLLDDRFLVTPSVAVAQSIKAVIDMITLAYGNYQACIGMIFKKEKNLTPVLSRIADNENDIDNMESRLTTYLVKISEHDLSEEENNTVSGIFHVITDIERIGDHSLNISESMTHLYDEGLKFSDSAKAELKKMTDAVGEVIELCIRAYSENDLEAAKRVQPIEAVVDILKRDLRQQHINRLTRQECDFDTGIAFLDIVNNLERISDHCSNIAIAVEQNIDAVGFDPHSYTNKMDAVETQEYRDTFARYKEKYEI